jgi:hypothetical protein
MALHAYWTHGAVGVSHVFTPSFELGGLAFTPGPNMKGGGEGTIWFPLPTPVIQPPPPISEGKRARLLRVFVLYELHAETSLGPVAVLDGQNDPGTCDPHGTGFGQWEYLIPGPVNYTGVNCLNDLIDNRTRFNIEGEHPLVYFGLAIVVTVRMGPHGKARFTSVGADYDIAA